MVNLASRPAPASSRICSVPGKAGAASHDPRWPRIAQALETLWLRGRRSVRIVDIDCGAGTLLLHALRHARSIGFLAIEGRGIDGAPTLTARARAAAHRAPDPAIGVVFDVADVAEALEHESDPPADIIIWHGSRDRDRPGMIARLHRAGDIVIGDDPVPARAAAHA